MALKHISGPAAEPLALDETKLYLRVDQNAEDDAIDLLIAAARELFERETGLILIRQSFELVLDCWPLRGADGLRRVYLPARPVLSLGAVSLTDSGGTMTTLDTDDYIVDPASSPPRLIEAVAGLWPKPGAVAAGISVAFDAGFGDAEADVPSAIRLALLKLVAELYEARALAGGAAPEPASDAIAAILAPYREARL